MQCHDIDNAAGESKTILTISLISKKFANFQLFQSLQNIQKFESFAVVAASLAIIFPGLIFLFYGVGASGKRFDHEYDQIFQILDCSNHSNELVSIL